MNSSRSSSTWLSLFAVLGLGCAPDPAADETAATGSDGSTTGDGDPTTGDGDGDATTGDGDGDGEPGDGDGDGDEWGYWSPGKMLTTLREGNARGFLDRRGLIHAHSVHSHDACDDEPKDAEGNYDMQCDRDFREGLCRSRHDFVFLTDHRDSYVATEYPEALLYRPAFGDTLVEANVAPIANWTGCDGFEVGDSGSMPFVRALLQAGSEAETMPIGLPAHVAETAAERDAMLADASPAGILALADAGAVTLVAHTEGWTVQELTDLPLDGFEMYNIHANLFLNIVAVGTLLGKMNEPESIPHPELVLLPLLSEDPAYIDTWSSVLASGARKLTTMGTDCHRNTFMQELADDQRIDSYERMMQWFSNHLLVEPNLTEPEGFGPAELDDALDAGRLFGVFEVLGFPEGFDYRGEQNGDVFEIGGELSLIDGAVTLYVEAPIVARRDPASMAPVVQLRLLRADVAGWQEVGFVEGVEGSVAPLEVEITESGAYRAEVRVLPKHLAQWLGTDYQQLVDQSFVWIYANPIYVRD